MMPISDQQTAGAAETLLSMLMNANKRASTIYIGMELMSAKLHGPRPSETANEVNDDSVSGLARQLLTKLSRIQDEVDHHHGCIGEHAKVQPAMKTAVGY